MEVPGDDHKEDIGFHGEMNPIPTNSDTAESRSASPSVYSEISSCREEDHNDDPSSPTHVKRPSAVTFRDPESNYMVDDDEDFVDSEAGSEE